jgi:hypothetical protein
VWLLTGLVASTPYDASRTLTRTAAVEAAAGVAAA